MSAPSKRIVIIGSGGREHALAWRARDEGNDVHVLPGSDGIAQDATCHAVATDLEDIVRVAEGLRPDLVIVGPEQPLVDGLGDLLRLRGLLTLGPSKAAAELEGSKAAAKAFMLRHGIPTARYVRADTLAAGLAALGTFPAPPVVKADGLAAGKGVVVPDSFAEAASAIEACLDRKRFGDAGATVVLEERLQGEELSFFVLSDGTRARTFVAAQDHKRLRDDDLGPNTGGMGAIAPATRCDVALHGRILDRIVEPTLAGLRAEGRAFVGILFVGLMIDSDDQPWVIEYNCRFGDPEAQPLLFGARDALFPAFLSAAAGELESGVFASMPAASVTIAAAGYPDAPRRGDPILGLDSVATRRDVKVFHAGTQRVKDTWVSHGGRVLGVCARAASLAGAIDSAYAAADSIQLAGAQMRRDIGARSLRRSS